MLNWLKSCQRACGTMEQCKNWRDRCSLGVPRPLDQTIPFLFFSHRFGSIFMNLVVVFRTTLWCASSRVYPLKKLQSDSAHISVIINYHYETEMHSFQNVNDMKGLMFQMRCWSKCLLHVFEHMHCICVMLNPIKASTRLGEWVQGQDLRHCKNTKLNLYTSALIKFMKPVCLNSPTVM